MPYRVGRRSWNTHHSRKKFARPRALAESSLSSRSHRPRTGASDASVVVARPPVASAQDALRLQRPLRSRRKPPRLRSTTSFPTDRPASRATASSRPVRPRTPPRAPPSAARRATACSTWNFKHAGGGFPAQCYIGMATHCDLDLAQVRRRPARCAARALAPCPWSGGKFCSMGASAVSSLHLPARRRCRRHVRQSATGSTSSAAPGRRRLEGQHRLQRPRRGSPRARSTSSSTRATARTARRATTPTRTSRWRSSSAAAARGAARSARARTAASRPVRRRPTSMSSWEAYSAPTFGHSYYHTSGQDLPGPRSDAVCIGLKEKVYVLGGKLHYGNDSSANVIAFAPSGTQGDVVISRAAAMPTDVSPACAAVLNGRIYAVGGADSRRRAPCALYPPSTAAAGAAVDARRRRLRGARRRAVRVGPVVRRRRAQGRRVHVRRHGVDRRDGDDADADDGERRTPNRSGRRGSHAW